MMIVFHLSFAWPLFAQQAERQQANEFQRPVVVPVKIDDSILVDGADISLRLALENQEHFNYWSWLNSKSFYIRRDAQTDKDQLRRQWQELLGVDVFMPYFKVKEAQDVVESKTKVTLWGMRGKAHFNENSKQVEYIFKKRF
ncbi:MAG: hypothetical protein MUC52_01340 [Candidatus Omnitrophica bacterium]|nr:hypothetical protein [Candidatus Omnitrophota bacterium]